MSDLFNIYEDSFNVLLNRVNKVIDSISNLSKEKSEQALQEANLNLTEAESHLKRMEIECDSGFGKNIERLKIKVSNYKNEYSNTKSKLYQHLEQYINKKTDVRLGNLDANLIDNEESFHQSEKLEQGKRTALFIENSAKQVSNSLAVNTDKMKQINGRTVELDSNIEDSDNIMTRMIRRNNKNRLIFTVLGLCLFCLLVIVIVYNMLPKDKVINATGESTPQEESKN